MRSTTATIEHLVTKSIEPADDWSPVDWYRWNCTCGLSGLHADKGINNMDARHHEAGTGNWKRTKARG